MSQNILIIYHSISNSDVKKMIDSIELFTNGDGSKEFNLISINEADSLEKLSVLSKLILNCDTLIVITSVEFQITKSLMLLLNYAKDIKANLYSINFLSNYKPFGALGAISISSEHGVIQFDKGKYETNLENLVEFIKKSKNFIH